ncbi:MAG: Ig-like domain-containing protein [Eubacterium sp.]|nr:Ig-like domain-containing protein [Eubacterium sp.]
MQEKKFIVKRALIYLLVFFLAFSAAFSYANIESNAAKKKVTSVKIAKKSATIEVGKTKSFKVKVKGSKGVAKRFTAKSSNKKIAKVKVSGTKIKITGVKKGKATITVTTKDKNKKKKKLKAKIKITVKKASATPTPTPSPSAKPTEKPVIANGIILSSAALNMKKGEKSKLTAEVKPANTTDKSLTWSSSDDKVASVDKDGNVSALKKGDAVITVSNKASGLKATCSVNVKTYATVSTQAELNAILAEGADEITINTGSTKLTIPAGKYDDCTLFIKGTGTVENNGAFKDVVIAGACAYTENATNNINVQAPASINVGSKGNASIAINLPASDASKEIKIENSGLVQQLDIATSAKVRLEGNSKSDSPVNVNISAENVSLITDHQANVVANQKTELTFTGNTDNTRVTVEDKTQTPTIKGVGFIEVTYSSTGEKEVIAAEPSDEMSKLDISGVVKHSADNSSMSDVTVTLVPFNKYKAGQAIPAEDILQTVTTGSDGAYKFTDVPGGNYCMIFEKAEYKNAVQYLAAASKYNSEYINETMEMIPDGSLVTDNYQAKLYGVIKDATTKDPIEGITVEIRYNKGNILGEAYRSMVTDENGEYLFEDIEGQQYTIYVKDERDTDEEKYISKNESVSVYPDSEKEKNITITKPVKGNGLRFVLTWAGKGDGVPRDLDTHLLGPSATGLVDYHHVCFSEKQYGFGNVIYSSLDVDETDYNGPETVTIVDPIDGKYHYLVFNYTAREDNPSCTLQNSDAKVDVYMGGQLLTSFNVPNSGSGDWWYVFTYDSVTGAIESKNQIVKDVQIDGKYFRYDYTGDYNLATFFETEEGLTFYLDDITGVEKFNITVAGYDKETGTIYPGAVTIYSSKSKEEAIKNAKFVAKEGYSAVFNKANSNAGSLYYGDITVYDSSGKVVDFYEVYYEKLFDGTASFAKAFRIDNVFKNYKTFNIYTVDPITEADISDIKFSFDTPGISTRYIEYYVDDNDEITEIQYEYTYEGNSYYFCVNIYYGCYVKDVKCSGTSVEIREGSEYIDICVDEYPEAPSVFSITCADGYTGSIVLKTYVDENGDEYTDYCLVIKQGTTTVAEKRVYCYSFE